MFAFIPVYIKITLYCTKLILHFYWNKLFDSHFSYTDLTAFYKWTMKFNIKWEVHCNIYLKTSNHGIKHFVLFKRLSNFRCSISDSEYEGFLKLGVLELVETCEVLISSSRLAKSVTVVLCNIGMLNHKMPSPYGEYFGVLLYEHWITGKS